MSENKTASDYYWNYFIRRNNLLFLPKISRKHNLTMKAQEYLNSLDKKDKIDILNLNSRNLTGEMNLTGFTNLKTLECTNNQITSLDVSNCPNLVHLNLKNNPLLADLHVFSLKKIQKLETGDNKRNSLSGIYS